MTVINYIADFAPHLDKLTNYSRWHNAWQGRVADTEFTELVEQAVEYFKLKK